MKLISLIKSTDFLGPEMKFRINNQENFKTVFGGFFSILYCIFFTLFFFIFGNDFFFKQNPKVFTQFITPMAEYSSKNFTSKNFTFAFRLVKNDSKTIPIFPNATENLKMYYIKYSKNESKPNRTNIYFKTCDETNFFLFNITQRASEYICADLANLTIELGGGYESINDFFGNLVFELKLSQSLFKNYVDLKNKIQTEQYKKLVENFIYLQIILPQVIFNPSDYAEPLKYQTKHLFSTFTFGSGIEDQFFFSDFSVETDAGILTESVDTQNKTGYNRKLNYFYFMNRTNCDATYSSEFIFDNSYNLSSRQYMKFQDLLGNIGGFMDLIMFIFSHLIWLNSDYRITKYIANKLIYVIDENELKNLSEIKFRKDYLVKIDDKENNDNNREYKKNKSEANRSAKNKQMENLGLKKNSIKELKSNAINNNFEKNKLEVNDVSSNSNRSNLSIIKLNRNNESSSKEEIKKQIKFCCDIPKAKDKRFIEYGFLQHIINCRILGLNNNRNNDKSFSNIKIAEDIFNQALEKFDILFYLKFINNFKLVEKLILDENVRFLLQRLSEKEYFYKNDVKENKLKLIELRNEELNTKIITDHFEKASSVNSVFNLEDNKLLKLLPEII
jgi:hypothetical protein